MRAEWPETGGRDPGADLGWHLVAWCVVAAAVAVYSCGTPAGAKSCGESLPYGQQTFCAQVPGNGTCPVVPPPASLHGELAPVRVLSNTTQYSGSITIDQRTKVWADLDIEGDRMAVAWWQGLELWRLLPGGNAVRTAQLNGPSGFPSWTITPEIDAYFSAVTIPDGDSSFVVLTGLLGTMVIDASGPTLVTRYQDETASAGGTIWGARIGGRSWAFVGTSAGVYAYDLTRTRDQGCVGALQSANGCPGVRQAPFGGPTYYVNGAVRGDGSAVLVRASGRFFPKGFDAWNVTAPGAPARIAGPNTTPTDGVALWEHRDVSRTLYAAARHQQAVTVYQVAGGTMAARASEPIRYVAEAAQWLPLTFSWSGDVPFVFVGNSDACKEAAEPDGAAEKLLRLADPHHPERLDVTDVSPRQRVTFTSWTLPDPDGVPPQPQADRTVDYWEWYAPNAKWGWGGTTPRSGMFSGEYFYRNAASIGDVHRWEPPPPSGPEPIFADGFESGSVAAWTAVVP